MRRRNQYFLTNFGNSTRNFGKSGLNLGTPAFRAAFHFGYFWRALLCEMHFWVQWKRIRIEKSELHVIPIIKSTTREGDSYLNDNYFGCSLNQMLKHVLLISFGRMRQRKIWKKNEKNKQAIQWRIEARHFLFCLRMVFAKKNAKNTINTCPVSKILRKIHPEVKKCKL